MGLPSSNAEAYEAGMCNLYQASISTLVSLTMFAVGRHCQALGIVAINTSFHFYLLEAATLLDRTSRTGYTLGFATHFNKSFC